jgi:hypothetical protein
MCYQTLESVKEIGGNILKLRFHYYIHNNKTAPLFDTPVAQLVSAWYLYDSIHQLISSIPMESNAEVASSILAWSNTGLFWTFFARQMFLKPPKFDTQFSASVLKIL